MTAQLKLNGDWKLPSKSGYSLKFISGGNSRQTKGGLPILQATNRMQPVPITATYELGSSVELTSFYTFYNTTIAEGSLPFEAKLDVGGNLQIYTCQLDGEISTSGWTGEYAAVTLPMLVLVNISATTLEEEYGWRSMFYTDEEALLGGLLPEALDPMAYTTYIP